MGLGYYEKLNMEPQAIPLSQAMNLWVIFKAKSDVIGVTRLDAFKTHEEYARQFIDRMEEQNIEILILDSSMGTVYESESQRKNKTIQITKLDDQFYAVQERAADIKDPASFTDGVLCNKIDGSILYYTNDDMTCPMLHDGLKLSSMLNYVVSARLQPAS